MLMADAGRYDVVSLESTQRKFTDWQLVKRIVREYMLRHKPLVAGVGLVIISKTILVLAGPFIYKVTLDNFISNQPQANEQWLVKIILGISALASGGSPTSWTNIASAGLVYVGVGALLWITLTLQEYYVNKLGFHMIADIRSDFFNHLEKLSQNFFEYGNTGKLVSRVTNDAEAMRTLVSSGMTA
jgi:ATP-binding cassette subfamily B protein